MSNVISFCDYKQKKLEEKIEEELYTSDNEWLLYMKKIDELEELLQNADMCSTTTFTITVDDEIVFTTSNEKSEWDEWLDDE